MTDTAKLLADALRPLVHADSDPKTTTSTYQWKLDQARAALKQYDEERDRG